MSSHDGRATAVEVEIRQSWRHILVALRADNSRSVSLAGTLLTTSAVPMLTYEYRNEPTAQAVPTMHMQYGTVRLELDESQRLTGDYYSGRGRENHGSLRLDRTEPSAG